MKTNEAKSYDEIYAELRPKNLSLDQYDIHELVGQAYADQQVNKKLNEAIDTFLDERTEFSLEYNKPKKFTYDECKKLLESLKIKQP